MQTIKLLLVEDDEDDYIITRDLLEDIPTGKYQMDWSNNLQSARNKLSQKQYDVCLLDYSLGEEDGLSLLMESPVLGLNCPVIMLTGQDDPRLDQDALSAGAVDYLVKSQLTASRLARAIRYAVSRREMEAERVERMRAESENKAKSEFLAHLSHELRTPLTAILGYTDILARELSNQQQTRHLEVIRRNGRHLLSLLNDILDLTKIEAGRLEIDEQPVALSAFMFDLFQLIQVKALDKDIDFQFISDKPLPRILTTDPTRLRQILMNLLSNAIKFTDQGKVELQINPSYKNDDLWLEFAVADTGIGIPKEEMARLFRPFNQANNVSNRSERGTGLGLAISKQLAKRLNGSISMKSELGLGSTFSLRINCGSAAAYEMEPLNMDLVNETKQHVSSKQLEARILVVDDLAEVRNLIGFIIENAGADVDYAEDGPTAIRKIMDAQNTNPFDLVLMDMQMPNMTGTETTAYLRKNLFDKPIVALTAATMKGERERCLAAGCSDHLSKPIDEHRLIERIRYHLGSVDDEPEGNRKKIVLLVEDDPDTRSVTSLLIQNLGWLVMEAANAVQTFEALKEQQPDMILMDINLPDCKGNDLAKKIKQLYPQLPIVALSGYDISELTDSPTYFTSHYIKPVTIESLNSILNGQA